MSKVYPKMMRHPAHVPAVIGPATRDHLGRVSYGQGEPERFPNVWVESEDSEEQFRAKGYLASGETPPAPVGFSEYPLMMAHPDHKDVVPDQIQAEREANGNIKTWVLPGAPEVLPHQTVNNATEEAEWSAKGYKRMGISDPDASAASRAGYIDGEERDEWPKWIDGQLVQDPATPGNPNEYPKWIASHDRVVNSREEEAQLLGIPLTEPKPSKPVTDDRDEIIARLHRELAALRRSVIEAKLPKAKRTRAEAQRARRERERSA